MRVSREEFLKRLESVSSGLAKREIIEQSQCFVFGGGMISTFNEEVAVRVKSPLDIEEGAVQADPLLALLRKMVEDELDIDVGEEGLLIKGKSRRSSIRMESEVLLPLEGIEDPGEWRKVPEDLLDALKACAACCSADESHFVLTCVHIADKYIEATDDMQVIRWSIKTGVDKGMLVRRDSISKIVGADPTEWSETENWLHFRNPSGLILSCRRYVEPFPDTARVLKDKSGYTAKFPKSIDDMLDKALIFSREDPAGNRVLVSLTSGRLRLKGEGASGWYEERRKVPYDGEPISFYIEPKLLLEISRKTDECVVGEGKVRVSTDKFVYLACTSVVEE